MGKEFKLNRGSGWVIASFLILFAGISAAKSFGIIDLLSYVYGIFQVAVSAFLGIEIGLFSNGFKRKARTAEYITLVMAGVVFITGLLSFFMISWEPLSVITGVINLAAIILALVYARK